MIFMIFFAIYSGITVAIIEVTCGKKAAYTALNVVMSLAIFLGVMISHMYR